MKEEALDEYLQGRFYWNRRGSETSDAAGQLLQPAIQIEPRYAPAYAGLAEHLHAPRIGRRGDAT